MSELVVARRRGAGTLKVPPLPDTAAAKARRRLPLAVAEPSPLAVVEAESDELLLRLSDMRSTTAEASLAAARRGWRFSLFRDDDAGCGSSGRSSSPSASLSEPSSVAGTTDDDRDAFRAGSSS